MTDRHAESADPECAHALDRIYEFLDQELDSASGDAIRAHLAACEPCLDRFDVEQAVKTLVHRTCGGEQAPSHLRAKVLSQLGNARDQAAGV